MRKPELIAQGAKVLFNQVCVEAVMACGHGSMSSEDDFSGDLIGFGVEVYALISHARANGFQHCKTTMALVEMENPWNDAHRSQRSEAANPQQQLLTNSRAAIAAIQPRGKLTIFGRIPRHIGVEQQQVASPYLHAPDLCTYGAAECRNLNDHGLSVEANRGLHGQLVHIGLQVLFPLPSVLIQSLQKISLPIKQANTDQRDVQIRCTLDVVASQNTESARVDGQRFVQPKLCGKVFHRTRTQ